MSVADNKRIAKNTIFLYIRMFVSILISLYTSRKILEALGIEDFGILNVVGGVISMLAFLNGSMSVATQRFLTVELGKKDYDGYNRVFNMSVLIHVGLAIFILIAAETIGLVLLMHILTYLPNECMQQIGFTKPQCYLPLSVYCRHLTMLLLCRMSVCGFTHM